MLLLFPLAGACKSLLDTTPDQRKEKEWKPIAILTSLVVPVKMFRIMEPSPPVTRYTLPFALFGSCVGAGIQWCAGRQFGHIVGQVLDKYDIKPT